MREQEAQAEKAPDGFIPVGSSHTRTTSPQRGDVRSPSLSLFVFFSDSVVLSFESRLSLSRSPLAICYRFAAVPLFSLSLSIRVSSLSLSFLSLSHSLTRSFLQFSPETTRGSRSGTVAAGARDRDPDKQQKGRLPYTVRSLKGHTEARLSLLISLSLSLSLYNLIHPRLLSATVLLLPTLFSSCVCFLVLVGHCLSLSLCLLTLLSRVSSASTR